METLFEISRDVANGDRTEPPPAGESVRQPPQRVAPSPPPSSPPTISSVDSRSSIAANPSTRTQAETHCLPHILFTRTQHGGGGDGPLADEADVRVVHILRFVRRRQQAGGA